MNKCIVCNNQLSGKQTKFCCSKCKNKIYQAYSIQQKRQQDIKKQYVLLKGGCCNVCGYDKNLAVLSFHHSNPAEKLFGLDAQSLANRKSESLEAELNKCILMCSNCHLEHHYPDLNNWNV